jgi:hypothetical protein
VSFFRVEEERMMCVWVFAQRFKALSEEKETGGTLTLAEEVTEYVEEDPSE